MSKPTSFTVDQLAAALRNGAKGVYPDEAAVELLIHHEHWLHRRDFRRLIDYEADPELSGAGAMAWVWWEGAIDALRQGELHCSSSEGGLLTIAASLAASVPVDLRDAVCRLDDANIGYLAAAILRANGRDDQVAITRRSASPDRTGAARAVQLHEALQMLEAVPKRAGTLGQFPDSGRNPKKLSHRYRQQRQSDPEMLP